jgi:hypothetical protein
LAVATNEFASDVIHIAPEANMKNGWAKVAGLLGIAYCIVGFFLVFLGWNGTASKDDTPAQMPYVVSGGLAGLGLIIVGSALLVAHSLRTDRVELRGAIDDLRASVARGGGASAASVAAVASGGETAGESDIVLVGSDSYHRPGCSLIEGQSDVVSMTAAEATAAGRSPCRICNPDTAG